MTMKNTSNLNALPSVFFASISQLFEHQSVRTFMNQVSQKGVLHFICDCVAYDSLLADTLGEDVA